MQRSVVEEPVGRGSELEELEQFLDRAFTQPRALVLEGDAGIGKTALWRAAIARAEQRGFAALASRPAELETAFAYLGLTDLLENRLEELLDQLPSRSGRVLERALLEPATGEAPLDQRAVCTAFLGGLRVLASTSPVLVAIDDAQWLDAASARALAFAARRLGREPVGFLVTVRAPRSRGPALELTLPPEQVDRTRIGPLDDGAIDLLLRERLGATFLRPTLRMVYGTSGGNPLFALELARAIVRDGAAVREGDHLPVPETLRDLVADRISRLPDDVRDALLVVAAAAQATVATVESALGPGEGAPTLLSAAVEADVIEVDHGRVRFTHPLLASVLYREAPLEKVHATHRRLAGVVADPEERARHLALATQLPDAEVAASLDEAARRARCRGAPDAAAALCEHALRLTPADASQEHLRRTIEAADSYADSGATARAHELLADLLAGLVRGPWRARVLHRLARLQVYEEGFRGVAGGLQSALDEAEEDTPLRAAIERDLALTLSHTGELPNAAPHARRALELARSLTDAELLADAEATAASVEVMLGRGLPRDIAPRAEALEPAPADDRLERHPALLLNALTWGAIEKWTDDFDGASRTLEGLLARLTEREEEGLLVPTLFHLAELECWTGNLLAAERHARTCVLEVQRAGQPGTRSLALYATALVDAHLGRTEDARSSAEEGLALAEKAGDPRMVIRHLKTIGFLEVSLADYPAASSRLGRALELCSTIGYGEPGLFRLDADAIESLVALGRLDEAAERTEQLAEQGAQLGRPWARATAGRSRALLAAARGALAEAEVALERALATLEVLPQPLELGRTVLLLGIVRRRMRQKRRAREDLERALAVFEALPAPLWSRKARVELGHISGRAAPRGELTATEGQVAELVAEGLTNREVASRLYVTQKTVEFHLRNVFRKLGVRSRTELARALAAKD